jgi:hypothetical protein
MKIELNVDAGWLRYPEDLARMLATARELECSPDQDASEPCRCLNEEPPPGRQFGAGIDDDPPPAPAQTDMRDRAEAGKRLYGWAKDQGPDILKLLGRLGERRGFPKLIKDWSEGMCREAQVELDKRLQTAGPRSNGRAVCHN